MARSLADPNPKRKLPIKRPNLPRLPDPNAPDVFEEMTLIEHLDELRSRLVKTAIGIGVTFVIGLALAIPLLQVIQRAANLPHGFNILSPTEPLTLYVRVAFYIAIAFAFPVIVWQLGGFLAPGLTNREKRFLITSLPFVVVLFLLGAAYAFFFAAPRALWFLSHLFAAIFMWDPLGDEVVNFYLTLMVGLGLAFELPVVMFVLAKLNLVSPQRMRRYRKYAAMVILLLAAIITPTTDPFNMAVVAVPLLALYELGILVSHLFARSATDPARPSAG